MLINIFHSSVYPFPTSHNLAQKPFYNLRSKRDLPKCLVKSVKGSGRDRAKRIIILFSGPKRARVEPNGVESRRAAAPRSRGGSMRLNAIVSKANRPRDFVPVAVGSHKPAFICSPSPKRETQSRNTPCSPVGERARPREPPPARRVHIDCVSRRLVRSQLAIIGSRAINNSYATHISRGTWARAVLISLICRRDRETPGIASAMRIRSGKL